MIEYEGECRKTRFGEADGKCPYARLPKSRGVRRTEEYAAVTRDEGNAALRCFDLAQGREPAERPFDFTQGHELVEWQMGVFRQPLNYI